LTFSRLHGAISQKMALLRSSITSKYLPSESKFSPWQYDALCMFPQPLRLHCVSLQAAQHSLRVCVCVCVCVSLSLSLSPRAHLSTVCFSLESLTSLTFLNWRHVLIIRFHTNNSKRCQIKFL
jgi:hypothetical protein